MKNSNKKGTTMIELMFIVVISGMLLYSGFNSAYKFYLNIKEKTMSSSVRDKINEVINANEVGRGINKDRIKANTLLFKSGTNTIDNYYYREVYTIDPVTGFMSDIPEEEFYGLETITFPLNLTFEFDSVIEGKLLTTNIDTGKITLGVKRTMPNNELYVFDGHKSYFQEIPTAIKSISRSDFTYGKGYKTLYKGDPITDTNYYSLINGATPPVFNNIDIRVMYNKKNIGDIIISTESKKMVYVDKRSQNK